jgi:hypothetical protein
MGKLYHKIPQSNNFFNFISFIFVLFVRKSVIQSVLGRIYMNQFDLLLSEFGTLQKLAKLIGVRPTAVYNWKARGKIPIKNLKKLRELSEGRLTNELLRPDLFKKD